MAPKAIYISAGLDVARWVDRLPEIETFLFWTPNRIRNMVSRWAFRGPGLRKSSNKS